LASWPPGAASRAAAATEVVVPEPQDLARRRHERHRQTHRPLPAAPTPVADDAYGRLIPPQPPPCLRVALLGVLVGLQPFAFAILAILVLVFFLIVVILLILVVIAVSSASGRGASGTAASAIYPALE